MSESLLAPEWLERLSSFKRLIVGYSGGLDSTVLLNLLAAQPQLHQKIIAIHINHGLSKEADAWQVHCQRFCKNLSVPLISRQPDFERGSNVEEHARNARYHEFSQLVSENEALVLAHHSNDQAETLLLHLFRGAGINGLAAMPEEKEFAAGRLLRPLLTLTREQLEGYAHHHHLSWVEDESNECFNFSRNYVRHAIMPQVFEKWPGLIANLNRTIQHCQQAKHNLDALAVLDSSGLTEPHLNLEPLKHLNRARLSNVLRVWIKNNGVRLPSLIVFDRLIDEVVHAGNDAEPCIEWDHIRIRRYQHKLYCLHPDQSEDLTDKQWTNFPDPLSIERIGVLKASVVDTGLSILPGSKIEVRFRKGGEQIRLYGQTKSLKKLFQQWQIPPWLRQSVPLVFINNHLACVVGRAVSDDFYKVGDAAYIIELNGLNR